jgi:hypothetical protein
MTTLWTGWRRNCSMIPGRSKRLLSSSVSRLTLEPAKPSTLLAPGRSIARGKAARAKTDPPRFILYRAYEGMELWHFPTFDSHTPLKSYPLEMTMLSGFQNWKNRMKCRTHTQVNKACCSSKLNIYVSHKVHCIFSTSIWQVLQRSLNLLDSVSLLSTSSYTSIASSSNKWFGNWNNVFNKYLENKILTIIFSRTIMTILIK